LVKIFLARHGDTAENSRQRYWGSTDVPLSEVGREQACRLAERLQNEPLQAVYSSDLQRAVFTAEAIADRHQLKAETCPELREINFGELEGLTFNEIDERYPAVADAWRRREPDLSYPGGESLTDFNDRVAGFQRRLGGWPPEANILVTAHSGTLRTLSCRLLGLNAECRWQFQLDLASLSIIDVYPEGSIISRWNDISHLRHVGTTAD
jgi:alpha-ribazole phosphatase